jgi:YidC/Oxa1 family membrane protein insertase
MHIAFEETELQILSHLLTLCDRSAEQVRSVQGLLAYSKEIVKMPSFSSGRIRPGEITEGKSNMNLDFIAGPLGHFLLFIYNTVAFHNYGLAILFFTFIVKLVLLPLTVKQYKSSAKMQELQPLIQEVQKRYKNDKEKLNQEMMKVYQENNYNPAGGCLPMLVQMPILISLYWVIIQPLKFMLFKSTDQITKLVDVATKALGSSKMGYQRELATLNFFSENKEALSQVAGILNPNELINFNFLGLHLGKIASYRTGDLFGPEMYIYLPLLILPILAVVTTFISTKLSMPKNTQNNSGGQNAMASSMTNSMLYIGPIMTLIFSFQLPAGVVLYWSAGYVFTIFQQLYINKHVIKKKDTVEVKAIEDKSGANANRNNSQKTKKKEAARKK